jgi:hypothetical protein
VRTSPVFCRILGTLGPSNRSPLRQSVKTSLLHEQIGHIVANDPSGFLTP